MARAIDIGPSTRCQLMVRDSSTTMTEARLDTSFNEYYSIAGNSSTHDANGNLTDNGDGHTFTWDAFNRLREVYEDGTPYAMEVYLYDASNRRVKIDVHYGSGVDTEFAYDGWQVVEEHYEDGGYPQVRQFVYGAYIDEPLMVEDQNGDCFFYHQNTIYSVYGISDEMGDVVEEYEYDPYGRHTASAGFEDNPYTFTGRRYDPESGLHYYRMRYYDAERGRFISRDRIGYLGGVNLHCYTLNNPIGSFDPSGNFTLPIGALLYHTIEGPVDLELWDNMDPALRNAQMLAVWIKWHEMSVLAGIRGGKYSLGATLMQRFLQKEGGVYGLNWIWMEKDLAVKNKIRREIRETARDLEIEVMPFVRSKFGTNKKMTIVLSRRIPFDPWISRGKESPLYYSIREFYMASKHRIRFTFDHCLLKEIEGSHMYEMKDEYDWENDANNIDIPKTDIILNDVEGFLMNRYGFGKDFDIRGKGWYSSRKNAGESFKVEYKGSMWKDYL